MTTHTTTDEARERVGSRFPVPDERDLPEDLRKLFAKAREKIGFVPNVFRAYAFRPDRLRAWFTHFKAVHEPTENLDAADRELIAVVVSSANRCLYCLVAHGAALRELIGDAALADRITLDYRRAGLDGKTRAILDYATKLTATPTECDATDIDGLRAHGLTLEEVWDVAEITAMYNFTNRMAMATGMLPNEDYSRLRR